MNGRASASESGSGSRKRPFEAIADGSGSGSGSGKDGPGGGDAGINDRDRSADVIACGNDHSNDSKDGRAKKTHDRSGQAVEVKDNNCDDCSDDESDCCSYVDEKDPPEIIDLQNALEYLVSERDIDKAYNGDNRPKSKDPQSSQSNIEGSSNEQSQKKEDEQLYMIPNLVNRILMEHYSSIMNQHVTGSQIKTKHVGSTGPNNMTREQTEKMTRLLLAVIVEFAEPHFVRITRHRDQERARIRLMQEQNKNQKAGEKKKGKKDSRNNNNSNAPQDDMAPASTTIQFDERATSWATACINQLLQPPSPSLSLSSNTNSCENNHNNIPNNNNHNDERNVFAPIDDDVHIPELDALLAASGPHDGMVMERRMQSALLHGAHGRRFLQNIGL